MNAKLREYLRSKGVSESELDKLDRGEVPSPDSGVLRKNAPDDPYLRKIEEIDTLLREIQEGLDCIKKADSHRAATARGVELFKAGKTNGHEVLDLPN